MMKLNRTRNPEAKAMSKGVAGTIFLIQLTSNTGTVTKFEVTARVAPVSLTLLVKTMMAPESIEYFVRGNTIVRNTPSGFAPRVRAASSMSGLMRSNAEDIDRTKYG